MVDTKIAFLLFIKLILKKSTEENKSMKNYPVNPFSAFNVCCRCSRVLLIIVEATTMNLDQTDYKGAILSGSFAIYATLENN